jgi:hypothetical protein
MKTIAIAIILLLMQACAGQLGDFAIIPTTPPPGSPPSPSSPGASRKSADILLGLAAFIGGVSLMAAGANSHMPMCDSHANCPDKIPDYGYAMMGGGGLVSIGGLYLLLR